MSNEIKTMEEFRYWVKVELTIKQMTQRDLARQLNVIYPRISEAVNGKCQKCVVPIIKALGGDPENFKAITQ